MVVIALVQRLLLGHRLPWQIWPAAAAMVGGAAMTVVPSIGGVSTGGTGNVWQQGATPGGWRRQLHRMCWQWQHPGPGLTTPSQQPHCCRLPCRPLQSAAGALNSPRAWLGVGLAVVAMLCAVALLVLLQVRMVGAVGCRWAARVAFLSAPAGWWSEGGASECGAVGSGARRKCSTWYTEYNVLVRRACTWRSQTVQATRHVGFSIWSTQYLFTGSVLGLTLVLTLALDGSGWAAQLGSWTAGDWAVLCVLGSVVYVGSNFSMQASSAFL